MRAVQIGCDGCENAINTQMSDKAFKIVEAAKLPVSICTDEGDDRRVVGNHPCIKPEFGCLKSNAIQVVAGAVVSLTERYPDSPDGTSNGVTFIVVSREELEADAKRQQGFS